MRTEEEIKEVLNKFECVGFNYGVFGLNEQARGFMQGLKWVLSYKTPVVLNADLLKEGKE